MSPATRARLLAPEDDEAQVIAQEFFRQREQGSDEGDALAEALLLARRLGCLSGEVPWEPR